MLDRTKTAVAQYLDIPTIVSIASANGVDAVHPVRACAAVPAAGPAGRPGAHAPCARPRATDSCPRTPILRRRARTRGSRSWGPPWRTFARSRTRRRRGVWPSAAASQSCRDRTVRNSRRAWQLCSPPSARPRATHPPPAGPVQTVADAKAFARAAGYPVIIKAAMGGGGRGMRVARTEEELEREFGVARAEAEKAFGDGTVVRPHHAHPLVAGLSAHTATPNPTHRDPYHTALRPSSWRSTCSTRGTSRCRCWATRRAM